MLAAPAFAASHATGYLAGDLMIPCRVADSDARETGTVAEIECEQYIMGVVDALAATGMSGAGTEMCPPDQNTADEVRWAFMRWVHEDFTANRSVPASEAVLQTLKASFPCNN